MTAYGDERPLVLQVAQQRRTVDDLMRQLELRESEISGYVRQIGELGEAVDGERRCVRDGRKQQAHLEELVLWYEEQLRLQQERADLAESARQSALRHAQEQSSGPASSRRTQTATAGDDSQRLLKRVDALAEELDAARAREEHACAANTSLAAELAEARRAAAQADETAVGLASVLQERHEYIDELEQQLTLWESVQWPVPVEQPAAPLPSPPPVAVMSLFDEVAKATDAGGAGECKQIAPRLPADYLQAPAPAQKEGALYWFAVLAHMVGALYLRLLVYPLLRIVADVVRAALGRVAPAMLARINVAVLLLRLGAAAPPPR